MELTKGSLKVLRFPKVQARQSLPLFVANLGVLGIAYVDVFVVDLLVVEVGFWIAAVERWVLEVHGRLVELDHPFVAVDEMDRSLAPVDRHIVEMDRSLAPVDRRIVETDRSLVAVDRCTVEMDRSLAPVDLCIVEMDRSLVAVDRGIAVVDL
jgi:hypothetical protein